jgi:hypothetical protein
MTTRRVFVGAMASMLLWPRPSLARPRTQTLFVIARSSNANVLHYDVRYDEGRLNLDDPLLAYWVMRAEDGRREGLTWVEREFAYGFRITSPVTPDGFRVVLKAFSRRELTVRKLASGGYRAYLRIDGKSATLDRLFVSVEGGGVSPTVQFVDLFGTVSSGKRVSERLVP